VYPPTPAGPVAPTEPVAPVKVAEPSSPVGPIVPVYPVGPGVDGEFIHSIPLYVIESPMIKLLIDILSPSKELALKIGSEAFSTKLLVAVEFLILKSLIYIYINKLLNKI
jgi:hypothetical protein